MRRHRRPGRAWPAPIAAIALLVSVLSALTPARADEGEPGEPADLAAYDSLIGAAERDHWAFQPVRRPGTPAVKDQAWPRNPIDQFVLAELESHGWRPSAPAEP